MKKIWFLLGISLVSLSAWAQQDKNIVYDANVQVRNVGSFAGVEISGAMDLYLSQGTETAVAISAADLQILDRIRTEVKDNILHIYFDAKGMNWKNWGNTKIKAYVTVNKLNRIEASGACNVKGTGPLKGEDLYLEFSGASDMGAELQFQSVKIDASGACSLRLTGNVERCQVSASGASSVKGFELQANYAKLEASGASDIRMTVNKELSVKASGGSNVKYKGNLQSRDVYSSGGASVKKQED